MPKLQMQQDLLPQVGMQHSKHLMQTAAFMTSVYHMTSVTATSGAVTYAVAGIVLNNHVIRDDSCKVTCD